MKKYMGNRPEGFDWLEIGVVEDEGVRWLVFIRPDEEWSTVKVVADGRALGKANYWLGWDGSRFGRHADLARLAQYLPAVFAAVERVLKNFSGVEGWDLL